MSMLHICELKDLIDLNKIWYFLSWTICTQGSESGLIMKAD